MLYDQIHKSIHGYYLEGRWSEIGTALQEKIEKQFKISLSGNPDVVQLVADTIGIEDARFVSLFQSRKSFTKDSAIKIILISAKKITTEAQNALLKVFEEPKHGVYYFVVIPKSNSLLPTLLSRLSLLSSSFERKNKKSEMVISFLSQSPSERLLSLENVIKQKDISSALIFLDDLLTELYLRSNTIDSRCQRALEEILRSRQYISNRGASIKLLLQHIALVTPQY